MTNLSSGSHTEVYVQDVGRNEGLFILQGQGNLYVPTYLGMRLGFEINNSAATLQAYPIFLGRDGQRLQNIWQDGPLDPNACSEEGEMWEVRARSHQMVDALMLGNQQGQPLRVSFEGVGGGCNELHIFERSSNAIATAEEGVGWHPGSRSPGTGWPIIEADDRAERREHVRTGVTYRQDAQLVGILRLIDRNEADRKLRAAGITDQDWVCRRYR